LGFVNFPTDRFGVQKPELKALTRTPLLKTPGELKVTLRSINQRQKQWEKP
jgi:hypothetical protein